MNNLDIEREVAKRHASATYTQPEALEVLDLLAAYHVKEARYWINLIDRVRYEAEQINEGQLEERPF